ncbi:MAG: oxidoreductase [Planctomycetes bacterium GWF2_50_10]|nr:MAG: oxidoreductase [Planctomycetes bacterium GWF2_50_10]
MANHGQKVKMGMVGGGPGAFIGAVHRMAAILDHKIELVCGAFSSDAEKSKQCGSELGLDESRVYESYGQMFEMESKLPAQKRMKFVSIVTPNHLHFPIAKMAMEYGFEVVCDKPLAFNMKEANDLEKISKQTGRSFCVTYNYTGYPMVKQAREMIRIGKIGKIRRVVVEYLQGWLATDLEASGQKQASWRTDPSRAGVAGCIGDIGSHAENIITYITGLEISEICADLTKFVQDRKLDDDGNILLRFQNGAKGVMLASQISVGEENDLVIKVYGEKGSVYWKQTEPNTLIVKWLNDATEIFRTSGNSVLASAAHNTRLPVGHPEGFIEAFANLYRNFASTIHARSQGFEPEPQNLDFPGLADGIRGMAFIEAVIKSSNQNSQWVHLSEKR